MILKTEKLHSVRLMARPAEPEGVTPADVSAATHNLTPAVCYRGPVVGLHACALPCSEPLLLSADFREE